MKKVLNLSSKRKVKLTDNKITLIMLVVIKKCILKQTCWAGSERKT